MNGRLRFPAAVTDMMVWTAPLPGSAKAALQVLVQQLEAIGVSIAALDQEIARAHAQSPVSRLLVGIPEIGTSVKNHLPIGASHI